MTEQLTLYGQRPTPPAAMKRQCRLLLEWMQQRGSITPLEAQAELGVGRLGARVWDLRKRYHYRIRSKRVGVENRRGERCSVSRYSLEGGA